MHAKGDKIRVAKKVDSKHRNIVLGIGTYCKNKLMMVEKLFNCENFVIHFFYYIKNIFFIIIVECLSSRMGAHFFFTH